jgi:hypothetical protein
VSIALFFVLSGFFLAALLGAVERNRKLLGIAGACLAVLACIIVFLKPVQLPPASQLLHGKPTTTTTLALDDHSATSATSAASAGASVTTEATSAGGASGAAGTTTVP